MVAGFCPLLLFSSSFFFLHPFHFVCGYFVSVFVGWRGGGLRQDTAAGG